MSDNSGSDNSGLYFIVGGLLVAVIAIGLYFGGYIGGSKTKTVTVEHTVNPDSSSTTSTTTTQTPH